MGFTTRVAIPHTNLRVSQGMGTTRDFTIPQVSHGPQVGPSVSERFEYNNPLTRELSGLTARIGALELRQEELGHSLDHNTSLTQESWGMISSMSYDWHHGAYYPPPQPDQ